jgi:hypothetical protein
MRVEYTKTSFGSIRHKTPRLRSEPYCILFDGAKFSLCGKHVNAIACGNKKPIMCRPLRLDIPLELLTLMETFACKKCVASSEFETFKVARVLCR